MDIQPTWADVSDHALLVMAVDLGIESISLGVDARPKLLEQVQLKLMEKRGQTAAVESAGPEILVRHGKNCDLYYLIDTPERKAAAFIRLFKQLDECGCYDDYDGSVLALARAGDLKAVRGILDSRRKCEYEGWETRRAIDPLQEKP